MLAHFIGTQTGRSRPRLLLDGRSLSLRHGMGLGRRMLALGRFLRPNRVPLGESVEELRLGFRRFALGGIPRLAKLPEPGGLGSGRGLAQCLFDDALLPLLRTLLLHEIPSRPSAKLLLCRCLAAHLHISPVFPTKGLIGGSVTPQVKVDPCRPKRRNSRADSTCSLVIIEALWTIAWVLTIVEPKMRRRVG
jgi:hypothetical protein